MPSLNDVVSLFKKCRHVIAKRSYRPGVVGDPGVRADVRCDRQVGDAIANGCKHADCPSLAHNKVLNDF